MELLIEDIRILANLVSVGCFRFSRRSANSITDVLAHYVSHLDSVFIWIKKVSPSIALLVDQDVRLSSISN